MVFYQLSTQKLMATTEEEQRTKQDWGVSELTSQSQGKPAQLQRVRLSWILGLNHTQRQEKHGGGRWWYASTQLLSYCLSSAVGTDLPEARSNMIRTEITATSTATLTACEHMFEQTNIRRLTLSDNGTHLSTADCSHVFVKRRNVWRTLPSTSSSNKVDLKSIIIQFALQSLNVFSNQRSTTIYSGPLVTGIQSTLHFMMAFGSGLLVQSSCCSTLFQLCVSSLTLSLWQHVAHSASSITGWFLHSLTWP